MCLKDTTSPAAASPTPDFNLALVRLEELLAHKEAALAQAMEDNETLQHQLRFGVDWMLHQRLKKEADLLPAPRLELTLLHNWAYGSEQEVVMVVAERDGTRTRVPLSYSKASGSGVPLDDFKPNEPAPAQLLPSLVNDLCYFSETTGLPAYVKLDDERVYKVDALRPLSLTPTLALSIATN